MPATIGTWLQDIWAGRDPNATPPTSGTASDQPSETVTSDVLRDRMAGLVRDPSVTPMTPMESMSYYLGLGLSGSQAGASSAHLDARGRKGQRVTSGNGSFKSVTDSDMPMSTWVIGTLALALAFLLGYHLWKK